MLGGVAVWLLTGQGNEAAITPIYCNGSVVFTCSCSDLGDTGTVCYGTTVQAINCDTKGTASCVDNPGTQVICPANGTGRIGYGSCRQGYINGSGSAGECNGGELGSCT